MKKICEVNNNKNKNKNKNRIKEKILRENCLRGKDLNEENTQRNI